MLVLVSLIDCLERIAHGERPFEDWMRAQGRSEAEILAVYALIDEWLGGIRRARES